MDLYRLIIFLFLLKEDNKCLVIEVALVKKKFILLVFYTVRNILESFNTFTETYLKIAKNVLIFLKLFLILRNLNAFSLNLP